jgi:hypothetical protein
MLKVILVDCICGYASMILFQENIAVIVPVIHVEEMENENCRRKNICTWKVDSS